MKVPARRRGNDPLQPPLKPLVPASMKVPARRRGNFAPGREIGPRSTKASMKVPARRRGNFAPGREIGPRSTKASMKVPARRRGNRDAPEANRSWPLRLNESPRPKAGKCHAAPANGTRRGRLNESPRPKAKKSESRSFKHTGTACASMKVPTRGGGNLPPAGSFGLPPCPPQRKSPPESGEM